MKRALLLCLGAGLLLAACSGPTVPRLPPGEDPNKPHGSDSTKTGLLLPPDEIVFLT